MISIIAKKLKIFLNELFKDNKLYDLNYIDYRKCDTFYSHLKNKTYDKNIRNNKTNP